MLLCGEPKTITMKKIYSILLASALTLSSCADFLDVDSQGKLTEDVFFGEEEGALMSINASIPNSGRGTSSDSHGLPSPSYPVITPIQAANWRTAVWHV